MQKGIRIMMCFFMVGLGYSSEVPTKTLSNRPAVLGKHFRYEASNGIVSAVVDHYLSRKAHDRIAILSTTQIKGPFISRKIRFESWNRSTDLTPVINNQCEYRKGKLRRCYALKFEGQDNGKYLSWIHKNPDLKLSDLYTRMKTGVPGIRTISVKKYYKNFNAKRDKLHDISSIILSAPQMGISSRNRRRTVYVALKRKVGKYALKYDGVTPEGHTYLALQEIADDYGKMTGKDLPHHVSVNSSKGNPSRSYITGIHIKYGNGALTKAEWH